MPAPLLSRVAPCAFLALMLSLLGISGTADGSSHPVPCPVPTDAFGYMCQIVSPDYVEADTVLPLTGDDTSVQVTLPFPFPFYGQDYTSAHISTNGNLNFLAPNASFANQPIPATTAPNAAIYAFWDDLFVDSLASVRTEVLGATPARRLVIEWRNVRFFGDSTRRLDTEAVLFEDGRILLQYRNIANDGREKGNSATVGIENEHGTIALQYSLNAAAIGDPEFALLFQFRIAVEIDIKPGSFPNSVNPRSQGLIPVAILSTPDFDALSMVDPQSVTFGRTGDEASLAFCNASTEDVNGDGFGDLVCHFFARETEFQGGDTQGVLKGRAMGGVLMRGSDSIRIVPEH